MSRPGSPARFVVLFSALVWLTGSSANSAPRIPVDSTQSATPPGASARVVCDSSTGRCYEYIQQAVDWHAAKAAAALRTHNGVSGHLVTITSPAESAFIVANVTGAIKNNAWIGAYRVGTETLRDGWEWVTGEPWDYTNWASVAPNNMSERAGLFWEGNGTWNDGHETHVWPGGYLVEYSPKPLGFDLVIGKAGEAGHTGKIGMLFNDGRGGFELDIAEFNGHTAYEVALGDLNGDRLDDVVVVAHTGQVYVARGGFSDGLQAADLTAAGAFTEGPDNCCERTRAFQLADVNKDGKLDIVVTMWAKLAAMLGNGDGTFGSAQLSRMADFDSRGLAVGDVTGDGIADAIVYNGRGDSLWLHKGNANGTFADPVYIAQSSSNIFVRDADGDGDLDVFAGSKVFLNSGTGSFVETSSGSGSGVLLVADDLNGDGRVDVVTGSGNTLTVAVTGGAVTTSTISLNPRHGTVGDFNKDGEADLAVVAVDINGGADNDGELWILSGNGDGTFQAPYRVETYRNNYTIAAGNFGRAAAPTGPTSCPAGSYLSGNACTPAPAGSYSAGGTATSATPCPAGTYSSDAGATACTPAAAGTYVSSTGATSATSCAAGSYSNTEGASACTLAPAGSYVPTPGATSASACTVGYYSNTAGSTLCTPAPTGWYVPATGATSATPCAAGTYSDIAGASECTLAPAGSYVPNAGATSATACPTHYSSDAGATSCYPLDTDNDGVLDKDDAYINSNLSAGVSVGACNAGVPNKVLPNGASFNDLLASAASGTANHGAQVSAVSALANGWKRLALISGREHGAIVSCVARSK